MGAADQEGLRLAGALIPYIGSTPTTRRLCVEIATLARRYQRIQVAKLNRFLTASERTIEPRLEDHIRALVASLPATDDGAITVSFDGDPRGSAVHVTVPNQPHAGNSLGLGGEFYVGGE
ncbi:MAG TPA: hypothetical protein VGM94_00905 [Galbitalea sp.]|jgi:hypothetical protein